MLNPIDRLPRKTRDRLARFAEALEGINANDYALFAATPLVPVAATRAHLAADEQLGRGARRDAAATAVDEFRDFATTAYARRLTAVPLLGIRSVSGTAADRLRFLRSLESAVIALILRDELEPADREELLGPWAELAEPAALP